MHSNSLRGLDLVVVRLLQVALVRQIILIMFVRRVARPVPVPGQNFDEQPLGLALEHKDRVDAPLGDPRSAHLHLYLFGTYQERLDATLRRRRTDRQYRYESASTV